LFDDSSGYCYEIFWVGALASTPCLSSNDPAKSKTHYVLNCLCSPSYMPTTPNSGLKQFFLCPLDETPSSIIN